MFDSLPENDGFWNRRRFLKAAGAVAAGATLTRVARAGANPDALALNGGTPAVTVPLKKQLPVLKWPQYAAAEKDAVKAALDCDCGNVYHYLYDLEDKWRKYVGTPFVKSHMNGTRRHHGDVLRPGSAAGQRDHGPVVHLFRGHHADAAVRLRAGVRRHQSAHRHLRRGARQAGAHAAGEGRDADALVGLPCEMDHILAISPRSRA